MHLDLDRQCPKSPWHSGPLLGKNRRLVTHELVEFEKSLVEVHRDFKRITDHSRGIYGIYLQMKAKPEDANIVTGWNLNHHDLDRLCIMPQNFPGSI